MDFRYRLDHLIPTTDGSGMVKHDIWAEYLVNGDATNVPNHHKTIVVPASDVEIVMDMPDSTGPERQAKNQAYKQLLVQHRNTALVPFVWPPVSDFSKEGLSTYMEAYVVAKTAFDWVNSNCALQAGRMMDYLVNVLGLDFPANPIPFNL